ncbi:hypothetical protein F4777DRAFT_382325 [Nemania sp. FL0916]|nr:hypothetical protein F4777DRAFT_382325 [Nemania sp. FL0916]
MSHESDSDEDASSDLAGVPVEQYSDEDESETDRGDDFFDMEAEESDDQARDGYEDDDDSTTCSFPQFSHLPPELRLMIWEAVDPYLKSEGRVFDFTVVQYDQVEFWESAILADQTAPSRRLLAANKESRAIALKHYPDVIQLRGGRGEIRFQSSNDIVLLRMFEKLGDGMDVGRWCNKIKYLAFEAPSYEDPSFQRLKSTMLNLNLRQCCPNIETVFICLDGPHINHRAINWPGEASTKTFIYKDEYWGEPYLDYEEDEENNTVIYCWPQKQPSGLFYSSTGGYSPAPEFSGMITIGSIPVRPMAQYSSREAIIWYLEGKRYYQRKTEGLSPLESSDSETFSESELDDYELDGFVVDGHSDATGGSSDDEDDGIDVNGDHSSGHDEGSADEVDGNSHFEQNPDEFNGFSPLQDPSDSEASGNLQNSNTVVYDLDPPGESPEGQPRAENQSNLRKRRIVSSDDEDDSEDGVASAARGRLRHNKRVRVALTDSEEEDGNGDGAEAEVEAPSRLRKRVHIVLSDSEHEEDDDEGDSAVAEVEGPSRPKKRVHIVLSDSESEEEKTGNVRHRQRRHNRVEDGEEDEDEDDEDSNEEDEEDDDEDEDEEEEPGPVKPMGLLARLRQFRSDVRVPSEDEASGSAEGYDEEEEGFEDDEENRFSDAQFPESAGEDGDMDEYS